MTPELTKILERRARIVIAYRNRDTDKELNKQQTWDHGYMVGKLYGIEHTLDEFFPNWEDHLVLPDKRFTV
jgi:hypothetical protein